MSCKRMGLFIGLFMLGLFSSPVWPVQQVVLVTSLSCPINTLKTLDLRKIYFGLPVHKQNIQLIAIRNLSDSKLNKIFLQTVVFMTEHSYHRRLLSMTLKYGHPHIPEIYDLKQLANALASHPCSISYLWRDQLNALPKSKILRILWQENG